MQPQNSQIGSGTQLNYNQQLVNNALIQFGTTHTVDDSSLDELMDLANACPLQQGTSVYQARALLSMLINGIEFIDDCEFEGRGERKIKEVSEKKASDKIDLYPNPNSGIMYLKYDLNTDAETKVYDVSGRILFKRHLNSDNNLLQMDLNLSDGIYFYSVIDTNGKIIKTDKLIIMK